jgi:glycine/D-amino acid oxidase-like deaminating enzyme
MRAIVIGGGIAGSSTTLLLRREGVEVTLIDPLRPRVNTNLIHSILLKGRDVELARRTLEFYNSEGIRSREFVSYTIGNVEEWMISDWTRVGVEARRVYVHWLGEEALMCRGGDRIVDVSRLLVKARPQRAKAKVEIRQGKPKVLINGYLEREADAVILAAGAWNGYISPVRIPSKSYYCWAFLTLSRREAAEHIIYDYDLSFYSRPFIGPSLPMAIVGDGEAIESHPWSKPRVKDEELLLQRVKLRLGPVFPILKGGGFCEATPDMRPAFGQIAEGLYYIGGFNGYGAEVGPALAEMLVDFLVRGNEDKEYSISRFKRIEDFPLGKEPHEL